MQIRLKILMKTLAIFRNCAGKVDVVDWVDENNEEDGHVTQAHTLNRKERKTI